MGAVAFKVIQYSASANVRSNCMGAVGESVGTPRAQRKGTDALSVRYVRSLGTRASFGFHVVPRACARAFPSICTLPDCRARQPRAPALR